VTNAPAGSLDTRATTLNATCYNKLQHSYTKMHYAKHCGKVTLNSHQWCGRTCIHENFVWTDALTDAQEQRLMPVASSWRRHLNTNTFTNQGQIFCRSAMNVPPNTQLHMFKRQNVIISSVTAVALLLFE